jgi:hypothetical protein
MKTDKILLTIFLLLLISCLSTPAYCQEISGWIKSTTCWVTEKPQDTAQIIGIIKQRASVTVEDKGNGWAEIIFAPVRNLIPGRNGMKEGKLFMGAGYYIKKNNITNVPPGKW